MVRSLVAARVRAKELLILDERDGPAARLKPGSEGTVLQIYAEGLNPAISLGVSRHPHLGAENPKKIGGKVLAGMERLSRLAGTFAEDAGGGAGGDCGERGVFGSGGESGLGGGEVGGGGGGAGGVEAVLRGVLRWRAGES